MTYELPGKVVKDASVVVNSVPEPSGELLREIRPALPNDDLATKDGADLGVGRLAFWIDTEGWLGVSVEEPTRLTAGGTRVQVRPLKFDPSAAECIAHEGDNDSPPPRSPKLSAFFASASSSYRQR